MSGKVAQFRSTASRGSILLYLASKDEMFTGRATYFRVIFIMMPGFVPERVFFEPGALEYSLGRKLYDHFHDAGTTVRMTSSHNRVTGIPGDSPTQAYMEAKGTLVVGVKRGLDFAPCKPSAHYQLPLATGCPGKCEYCYLATTLGNKPYVRVYVNVDQILARAESYIKKRLPEATVFEGAATSDPLAVEPLTGSLARAIDFFAGQEQGRFRFVTKQTAVHKLLPLNHRGHTRFRFSLNCRSIIHRFEHGVPGLDERVEAAGLVAAAGYPIGFIIAPIFVFPGWKKEYQDLIDLLRQRLGGSVDLPFELISHRFTTRAKNRILEVFPGTGLPMDPEDRQFKFGQFGYGKYVYPKTTMEEIKAFLADAIISRFPQAKIDYFV